MAASKLIEFFSTHTKLPIKIETVRDQIIEMGIQDEITFIGVDLDLGKIRGQFVRTISREAVYADPIFCSDIYYARNQDIFWQRFVCCKEMMHMFDKPDVFIKTAEELAHLTDKLSVSPELQFSACDNLKVNIDKFAILQALCVLFPLDARNLLIKSYNNGLISSEDISRTAEIPEKYIRLAMQDFWHNVYEAILGIDR